MPRKFLGEGFNQPHAYLERHKPRERLEASGHLKLNDLPPTGSSPPNYVSPHASTMASVPQDSSSKSDAQPQLAGLQDEENAKAAQIIQRTYRGHRTRRQLRGFGLDAETRWYEVVKDAQYHKLTTPAPPTPRASNQDQSQQGGETNESLARTKWKNATDIARRAGQDDHSSLSSEESSDDEPEQPGATTKEERDEKRKKRALAIETRKQNAKMMDLQYFLEMVDQKHRYGSNLRKYHNYWKDQDTNQNFFYWLDQGDGKDVELEECSRTRLETMQVRYLSREERQQYLVKVDNGLLVWAKNGERVWTKDELYRDSVKGIVPTTDSTPQFKYNVKPEIDESSDSDFESEDESDDSNTAPDEGAAYVNEDFHRARGPAKLKHVTAAALFNHMIRKSLKKGHKWIFVADTSFRMYIGYKQSGAFQHSSFLHGSRITAAGLIKVKDGQLRSLAPLSGHYRPPAANFRAFVHNLRDEGVDMSRVNISKSYAVLVGLEGYTKTRKRVKAAENAVTHEFDKVVRPEKVKQEEEENRDKSESAEKERQYLEQQRLKEEEEERQKPTPRKLSNRLSKMLHKLTGKREEKVFDSNRGVPGGTGPEDGVPPPEGKR